jgi:NADPH2:quinone reductase
MEYAGVNFIDTYQRRCLTDAYKLPIPFILGREGAGVVAEVGQGVTDLQAGERVCFGTGFTGSYSDYAVVPEKCLIKIPDGVDSSIAAASMLQGMTAHYLATSVYNIVPGSTCLVHAAAGGVGRLLCQIAKLKGASLVIGTCGNEEKAEEAKRCGADHVILYRQRDFAEEVKKLTGGKGVDVVFDGVGADTWKKSMECLRPRGMLALYGNASGPVPPVDPLDLMKRGSLVMTRTNLAHFTEDRQELCWRASDVLNWVKEGKLNIRIDKVFDLTDVAKAHDYLENRETKGKVLLKCAN